jgi:hypothetical protein
MRLRCDTVTQHEQLKAPAYAGGDIGVSRVLREVEGEGAVATVGRAWSNWR